MQQRRTSQVILHHKSPRPLSERISNFLPPDGHVAWLIGIILCTVASVALICFGIVTRQSTQSKAPSQQERSALTQI